MGRALPGLSVPHVCGWRRKALRVLHGGLSCGRATPTCAAALSSTPVRVVAPSTPQCCLVRAVPPSELFAAASAAATEAAGDAPRSLGVPPPRAAAAAAVAAAVAPLGACLARAASAAAAGRLHEAVAAMDALIAREEAACASGPDGAAHGAPLPPLTLAALLYAELLEVAAPAPTTAGAPACSPPGPSPEPSPGSGEGEGEAGSSQAGSSTVAALERLARHQLGQRAKDAPRDSLGASAQVRRAGQRVGRRACGSGGLGGGGDSGRRAFQGGSRGGVRGLPTRRSALCGVLLPIRAGQAVHARRAADVERPPRPQLLAAVLHGRAAHPVARAMSRLAEENLSAQARQAAQVGGGRAA